MSDGINDSIPGRGMRKAPMKEAGGKHPLRCETCENHTKKGSCLVVTKVVSKIITNPEHFDNGEGIFINQSERDLIDIIGCASHSSAGEPDETTVCWHCPFQKGCDYGEDYCEWPCKRWFNWHDQQVAQAEREKVLNPVWQFFMDHDCEVRESHGQKWYWVSGDFPLSELMQLVESLRGEGK